MAIRSRLRTVVFLLVVLLTIAQAQRLSPAEREILQLQDQRSLGEGKLIAYLSHTDTYFRYRAAIALANVQDTTTAASLYPLLQDNEKTVRAAAAFALGQIGSRSSEKVLLEALEMEKDPSVLSRVLEALGKIGGTQSLERLVSRGKTEQTSPLGKDFALGVARFALRGIKSEQSIWFCFELLKESNPETRWTALFALWRSAPHRLIEIEISKNKELLGRLAADKSADVRMHLAILLGKCSSTDAIEVLQALGRREQKNPDWRVQAQMVKSFGTLTAIRSDALDDLTRFLSSGNDHVKITTLQTIASLTRPLLKQYDGVAKLEQALFSLATTPSNGAPLVQGEAIVALGKHFSQRLVDVVKAIPDNDYSVLLRSKYLEALSFATSGDNIEFFMQSLDHPSARVSMAAWDFLKRIVSRANVNAAQLDAVTVNELPKKIVERSKSALARKDMAVTTLVANFFADTSTFYLYEPGQLESIVDELLKAYSTLSLPNDVEAMQAVIDALGKLPASENVLKVLGEELRSPDKTVATAAAVALRRHNGVDSSGQIPKASNPLYSDYDWETLEAIKKDQRVQVTTNKGTFTIKLLREDAAFTVMSFVKLLKKKFYDGLTFHRVVPNFVAQGGDPRGDGWGGPGYAIRSEFSLVNYERGSCGIASAGKDTEGCQFFITHLPTPHLDGRYTIFAKVVQGMEVVDKIQVGDKISSVRLIR